MSYTQGQRDLGSLWALLTVVGGVALMIWGYCVLGGIGIGYNRPVPAGVLFALWRVAKAIFLGTLGGATVKVGVAALDEAGD